MLVRQAHLTTDPASQPKTLNILTVVKCPVTVQFVFLLYRYCAPGIIILSSALMLCQHILCSQYKMLSSSLGLQPIYAFSSYSPVLTTIRSIHCEREDAKLSLLQILCSVFVNSWYCYHLTSPHLLASHTQGH